MFEKGKSGNPGGRPKIAQEVKLLAQAYSIEAIEYLYALMKDKSADPKTRKSAADSILDRAIGKPSQDIEISADADLTAILNLTLKGK